MLPCIPKRSRHLGDTDIKAQKVVSKEIDKFMKKEKRRLLSRHNILLLGTGESGKSTFLKQMKLINGKKFTDDEMKRFKDTIYDNIYKGILFLIHAQQTMNIELENPEDTLEASDRMEAYYKLHKDDHKVKSTAGDIIWTEPEFLKLSKDINTIWQDNGIKKTFDNRAKMMTENFSENTRFYLNKFETIGISNYIPSNEDIVWSRKPTDSIIEEEIDIHGSSLVFIDVGGQTKERKKWCQVFQDMNSVLFLIACSHYDEHYYDRMSKEYRNKLREAMRVFEDLINVQYFLSVSVIIFFNKTDVLIEKINSRISNIRDEFPNEFPASYDQHNIDKVQKFLVDTFVSFVENPGIHNHITAHPSHLSTVNSPLPATVVTSTPINNNSRISSHNASVPNNNVSSGGGITRLSLAQTQATAGSSYSSPSATHIKKRTLYRHFTTAIDRKNIETVFNAMKDTILQRNIDSLVMK